MAKPLLAPETIYEAALDILDREGPQGLSARNLAAHLQCSTRTLYRQVGRREEMIGRLVAHYFAGLQPDFERGAHWQTSALAWSATMRSALLAHPNLLRLMTVEHRAPVADYVNELLKVLLQAGFDEELALRACRVLINVVISLCAAEIATPATRAPRRRSRKEIQFEDLVIARAGKRRRPLREPPEVFANAVQWLISGIERERAG